jgi:ABC-2 type transport system permease protein
MTTMEAVGTDAHTTPQRRPPIWWVLVRHEWRLTMRDFFNFAAKRKKGTVLVVRRKRSGRGWRWGSLAFGFIAMHVIGSMAWFLPRAWHDTTVTRVAVVALFAFLSTFMLSYTMSRVVAAFHERRDLDLMLSAPIDPALVLAIRSLTVVGATTMTFAIFIYPVIDMGLITRHWWMARWYAAIPLLALIWTSIALVIADAVVRLIGVRRARVGLQIFSALVGASMYFASQSRNFLPKDLTDGLYAWFSGIVRIDDAPWPIEAIAAIARGDVLAWFAFVIVGVGLFAAATWWARRRFVEIAQTPDSTARTVQPARTVIERRFETGFGRGLFASLLIKEWRLILRAPQLLSQVLLQLLYLMPLMFVAFKHDNGPIQWGPAALAGGITGIASTLATALAWLTVAAEDAPDLLAGSPRSKGTILSAKLVAAALPPIVIVAITAIGTAQRSPFNAAVVLLFGILSCISAAILSAASPVSGKRSDFQNRNKGRGVSAIVEAFQFLLWAGAAGTASSGYWIISLVLTLLAFVMPALRLPRALRQFNEET